MSKETPKKSDLKSIAKQFSSYLNAQYREAVAYTPDADTVEKVTVSNWLEMPKAVKNAIGLPGLPFGNITCVYGKPDTGKTTFLMQAIAQAQKQDVLPVLILTEHKFDFTRLPKFMEADTESMLVLHADTLEQGYKYVEKVLKDLASGRLVIEDEEGNDVAIDVKNQKVFIFWDSIGNTMSESEMQYEVDEWDKSMGKSAKAIKTLTKRVNHLLSKVRQQVGILLLNQSYMSMPSYGPSIETPFGGEGVPYSSALVLRFRKVGDLKMTKKGKDVIIGIETKIEVKKNHITHERPVSHVYTVASGMIPAEKEDLDSYKKMLK